MVSGVILKYFRSTKKLIIKIRQLQSNNPKRMKIVLHYTSMLKVTMMRKVAISKHTMMTMKSPLLKKWMNMIRRV